MKILGIIAEYNPLHNGHIYHLKKAQEISHDLLIVVISSTFNSRGEISLLSSSEKTKLLLDNNVDIIIELPFILSLQSADLFAYHAVKTLNHFNVDTIVSGSEENNLDYIKQLDFISKTSKYNDDLLSYLNEGFSYKVSSNKALEQQNIKLPNSNDMLNWKYYSAINKINKDINLSFIKRINSDYLDKAPTHDFICSATSIRESKNYLNYVPKDVEFMLNKKGLLTSNNLDDILVYKRNVSNKMDYYFVEEGLDNAFLKTKKNTFDDIALELSNKRYTTSRIRRMLLNIIFEISKDDAKICLNEFNPRVLGFNQKGQEYLNKIKKNINFFTNLKSNISLTYDIEIKILKTISSLYKIDFFKENQRLPIKK